jgi:hypothetical protein
VHCAPHVGGVQSCPGCRNVRLPIRGDQGFDAIVNTWRPLVFALSMVNRSMGKNDLHPTDLPPSVLNKMRFIHTVIDGLATGHISF